MNVEIHHFCVYLPFKSNRLSYVLDVISNRYLNLEFTETRDVENDPDVNVEKVVSIYKQVESSNVLQFPHLGILTEDKPTGQMLSQYKTGLHSWNQDELPKFDYLGHIFLCLSRYEEYVIPTRDDHGRFSSKDSILSELELLETPIVDMFIFQFVSLLEKRFKIKVVQKLNDPSFYSTIDIDLPWKYQNLKLPYNLKKLKNLSSKNKNDPFDTYQEIKELHERIDLMPYVFFLTPGSSQYDFIDKYKIEKYRNLIREIGLFSHTGMHPPYHALDDKQILLSSKEFVESALSSELEFNRMHYLRLNIPITYRLLIDLNLKYDFTLGFADSIGFRAGTSRPFYWYDIEKENKTELKLFPISAMDVTLKNYMKLNPDHALKRLKSMYERVIKFNGSFQVLWHNSSLDEKEWSGWKDVYHEIILHCGQKRGDA